MAFIETIAPAHAGGEAREMYARQQEKYGYVPNYARVFSHRPAIMTLWAKLLSGIKRPMDPVRFELVTFAVAHELGNSACALAHGRALTAFFSEEEILAIAGDTDNSPLDATNRAIIGYARKLARDASAINADDIVPLKAAGLDDGEIFDIAAAAAARAFFTKLLDGLGVAPDFACWGMAENFRQALTVGRAISTEPDETLNPDPETDKSIHGHQCRTIPQRGLS